MDSSTHSTNSVSEDNCCEQRVSCEKYIEPKQCTSSSMIETAQNMFLEVAVSSISEKDVLLPREAGISTGIMSVTDPQGQSSSFIASSDDGGMVDSKENEAYQEFSQPVSLDAKVQKGLRKCVTFPSSTDLKQAERPPNTTVQGHNLYAGSSSYTRSLSLPLVSAMRGGRAQNGISPNEKLYVKWAPEVYDPPTTLMSHTVKSHQQRTKVKKKENRKHKNIKGKSTRGSNAKKSANRRNIGVICDPLDTRLEVTKNGLLLNKYAQASLVEILTVCVSGPEDKCGTSFLKEEGLAKTHLSTTEA